MASPDVFKSSPLRVARRESHMPISSSPDLPSIQDMLSQRPKPTKLRSGSKAAPIPDDAPTSFRKASSLWRSAQVNGEATSHTFSEMAPPEPIIDVDESVSVIEVPPQTEAKPRKPKQRRRVGTPETDVHPTAGSPMDDQPWKKFKATANYEGLPEGGQSPVVVAELAPIAEARSTKQTDTMSSHFQRKPEAVTATKGKQSNGKEPKRVKTKKAHCQDTETTEVKKAGARKAKTTKAKTLEQEPMATSTHDVDAEEPKFDQPKAVTTKKADVEEPLRLEFAMARRLDWTPPKQNTRIVVNSASPAIAGRPPSTADEEQPRPFQNLLQTYGCKDITQSDAVAKPGQKPSLRKKRKLIELITTKTADGSILSIAPKSPVKQKAPKKKARTITDLATAAYRVQSPDPEPPTAQTDNTETDKGCAGTNEKAPVKPRKRAAKASKKKPPPPKPLLLSPTAALRQVAAQDFVFGTSSQLAIERSPSFLRDLQAAMRHSNRLEYNEVVTPINSDAIEPPEQRAKLWDAGARDADGDLFDLNVNTLAEDSPELPAIHDDSDPFGYVRGDDEQITDSKIRETNPSSRDDSFVNLSDILPPIATNKNDENIKEANDPRTDDSFMNLSDVLPATRTYALEQAVDASKTREAESPRTDDSFMNLSDILAPGNTHPIEIEDGDSPFNGSQVSVSTDVHHLDSPSVQRQGIEADTIGRASQAVHPPYDLYTDAQLFKEVATSGLGPVKRRCAMIALLDKSWQSKIRPGQGMAAAMSTVAGPASAKVAASSTAVTKRPRGRPRKNSAAETEVQEPPPSAQPTASPKKPRGRPRKDAASPSKTGKTKATTKTLGTKKPARVAASSKPKGKKASSAVVLEIPDSASEISASPCSSPEPTFSPSATVDLSLSMDDDTELSLLSPTDQQVPVFTHITKAITTAPRTTDPANPSWHEKILLYDPIVLEDLAAWLNMGQLAGVGYDGIVTPGEVKKWCESKSVCCMWRISLRGRERKRL